MACPIYKGAGQPNVDGGWLAGLGSWFGGNAPVYVRVAEVDADSGGTFQQRGSDVRVGARE